jgi:hypothetical protein
MKCPHERNESNHKRGLPAPLASIVLVLCIIPLRYAINRTVLDNYSDG